VGCRRGIRISRFYVTLLNRFTLIGHALPEYLAASFVEGIDRPAMARAILRSIAIAIKSGTERRLWITTHSACHKDAIAPNDRARVREARKRCAPENVFTALGVPGVRQVLALGDA